MSVNEPKILPLRDSDLVFSKNRDGIVSCGYKVSNALLNSTLSFSMTGGDNGDRSGEKNEGKNKNSKNKQNDNDLKTAKLMEDLVIPSSLYYCKPISKTKVFNYKKGKRDKGNKKTTSDSDVSDDDVIEDSLYDKLLSLVSVDKKVKYDKRTRKVASSSPKQSRQPKISKSSLAGEATDAGENAKIKVNNKKTRKVRFDV
jgi:hypothetical protein